MDKWASEFINSLKQVHKVYSLIQASKLKPTRVENFKEISKYTKKKMMFLGYGQTLVNFTKNPQDAKPDSPLFQLLKRLKI